eukprot:jgi/Undpi1/9192/HiC_scaffold_26.g11650.m1
MDQRIGKNVGALHPPFGAGVFLPGTGGEDPGGGRIGPAERATGYRKERTGRYGQHFPRCSGRRDGKWVDLPVAPRPLLSCSLRVFRVFRVLRVHMRYRSDDREAMQMGLGGGTCTPARAGRVHCSSSDRRLSATRRCSPAPSALRSRIAPDRRRFCPPRHHRSGGSAPLAGGQSLRAGNVRQWTAIGVPSSERSQSQDLETMGLLARIDTKTASRPLSYAAGAEDAATNEREVAAAPVTTQTRPRPGGMRIWGAKEQRRGADGRRSGQKRQTRSALAELLVEGSEVDLTQFEVLVEAADVDPRPFKSVAGLHIAGFRLPRSASARAAAFSPAAKEDAFMRNVSHGCRRFGLQAAGRRGVRGSKGGVGIEYPEAVSPGTGGVAEGGLDVGSGVGGRGHAARLVAARRHGIGNQVGKETAGGIVPGWSPSRMETIAPPGSAAVASHSPEARGASSNTQHPSSKTNLGKFGAVPEGRDARWATADITIDGGVRAEPAPAPAPALASVTTPAFFTLLFPFAEKVEEAAAFLATAAYEREAEGVGTGVKPMHGDFEAQRHWMEITTNLPLGEWYRFDVDFWGLDYPPLTAYVSWACGQLSKVVDPASMALGSSRGYETSSHKVSVKLSCYCWLSRRNGKAGAPAGAWEAVGTKAFLMVLLHPALVLIDHGHFQYNSICLGLAMASAAAVTSGERGGELFGSVLFALSLNFKQMALYYAPAFFFYLLAWCLWGAAGGNTIGSSYAAVGARWGRVVGRVLGLGLVVALTFALLWAPFCVYPHDADGGGCLSSLGQVLFRLFPFSRGLFEDKVANLWFCMDVAFKLRRKVVLVPHLPKLALAATLSSLLVPVGGELLRPGRPLTPRRLLLAMFNSSMAFFLCSFQVHEKSLLLPLCPLAFLWQDAPLFVTWLQAVGVFSMTPLLARERLLVPCAVCTMLYCGASWMLPGVFLATGVLFDTTKAASA